MTASPNASLFTYPRFLALNTEGYPLAGGKLLPLPPGIHSVPAVEGHTSAVNDHVAHMGDLLGRGGTHEGQYGLQKGAKGVPQCPCTLEVS